MTLLPVQPAHRLATQPDEHRWLVDQLWSEQAVGIIGGEPKVCKSFLALDLAVAVASGRPCLRRFAVARPGRVLLYAAEDALPVVRGRLDGIARAAGVALDQLDVLVITAPRLRLDIASDVERLARTVAALRPRLLILDPFVRLHRRDENASSDIAPLLDLLRDLQRRHELAVLVVHHARKGGANVRAGQALRGSSEFHAWGDSLLYLRRQNERLVLSVEHRAAPGVDALTLRLNADDGPPALEIVERRPPPEPHKSLSVHERLRQLLAASAESASLRALCASGGVRKATLCQALGDLVRSGEVLKTDAGYALAKPSTPGPGTPPPGNVREPVPGTATES
jgi:hypothetical protein